MSAIVMSSKNGRRTSVTTLACIAMLLLLTAVVLAATPVWSVASEGSPTDLPPGGTGTVFVQVADVGPVDTNGSKVTVVDTLPEGLEATEAGETVSGEVPIGHEYWDCEGVKVVTCTNDAKLPVIGPGVGRNSSGNIHTGSEGGAFSRHEAPEIAITVKVAQSAGGDGVNMVRVSGGGATAAADSQPLRFSAAEAQFGIARLHVRETNEDGSADSQAGSHPHSLTVEVNFNNAIGTSGGKTNLFPVGNPKDIQVAAPVGFVGDPQAVPRCSREEFDAPTREGQSPACPPDTQVGFATVDLGNSGPVALPTVLPVYNLVPPPGVPAQFGFQSQGIYGTLDASLRTGGDYGITENVNNTAQRALISTAVTLWGVPADPSHNVERFCLTGGSAGVGHYGCESAAPLRPFLSNPTSCGPQQPWRLTANSWLSPAIVEATAEAENNLGVASPITGCDQIEFKPELRVQPDTSAADSPSGLSVDVRVPQSYNEPDALAVSTVKKVTVALPAGMAISPSAANGLAACSPGQIGISNALTPSCPDASKVGSVEVKTPLLPDALHGSVFLAQQNENPFGSLLAIYITVEGDGVLVKLAGHVEADPLTGQLTTTVDNIPQLPFEDFKLNLFGGPQGPLITPAACGAYSAQSAMTPYSSGTPVSLTQPFTIGSGCGGSFAPSVNAGSTSTKADKFTGFTTTISRGDGEQRLSGVQIKLPPGLLGVLKSVVQCPEPAAAQGTCGPESLIGHTTVAAGPGSDPFWIGGQVFLTGPYHGAPFGLSIVTHAVAGPFDLGLVIVRAKIEVDRNTAQVSVTSDPLPTILQGIPLDLKTVNVVVDRSGFIFNPTSCSAMSITGAITSTTGAVAGIFQPFQASECATLPFKPKLTATTNAKTSKANGASLHVKVVSGAGQANIHAVKVDLPKQMPSRLTTLQKACLAAVFDANPGSCPTASDVGSATAVTPILAKPLTGPAYLVSHGGAAFPDLEIVLQGEGITIVLDGNTHIKKGITSSTFKALPDAPISLFDLVLPTGFHSALAGYGSFCKNGLKMPTQITGQNGAVIKQTTKISVSSCPKGKPHHKSKARKAGTEHNGKRTPRRR